MQINNEIVNELGEYRARELNKLSNCEVTKEVFAALDDIAPGAKQGLQGIDAGHDGLTREMWDNAVSSADTNGWLVCPHYEFEIPADAEALEIKVIKRIIATQVATAILIVHGYDERYAERVDGIVESMTVGPPDQD